MNAFTRHLHIGRASCGEVFVTIKYALGNLSIVGVEGPMADGNARGGCGQIIDALAEITTYAEGWDAAQVAMLRAAWETYHLNDCQAGSPAQTAYLRAHPIEDRLNHYTKACEALAAVGLNPDPNYLHNGKPYSYGHAWLRIEVPASVLAMLQSLPEGTATLPARWAR
jgi:hypothetical protein